MFITVHIYISVSREVYNISHTFNSSVSTAPRHLSLSTSPSSSLLKTTDRSHNINHLSHFDMAKKVLLLYGSGPNVGAAILKTFAANDWKTAAVVRTMKDEYSKCANLVLQADLSDAQAIQQVYDETETKLGTPSCVVYNGV